MVVERLEGQRAEQGVHLVAMLSTKASITIVSTAFCTARVTVLEIQARVLEGLRVELAASWEREASLGGELEEVPKPKRDVRGLSRKPQL